MYFSVLFIKNNLMIYDNKFNRSLELFSPQTLRVAGLIAQTKTRYLENYIKIPCAFIIYKKPIFPIQF